MKNMKKKTKYIVTIIATFTIGVLSTIITLNHFGLLKQVVEVDRTVNEVNITEADSISSSVDKIYNSVVYIESLKNKTAAGSGSGFVYKVEGDYGYILTNQHVIDGATEIEITNIEGKVSKAEKMGEDAYSDIAVLRISKNDVLAVAEFGSSVDAKLGDTVFTVGSPVGKSYMGSVTKGILSGKDRQVTVSSQYVMEVIQVDAALNPGNSGGPLANINGEVIGINSLKLAQSEIEGMGFAIPIEMVKTIADKLEKKETIKRPLLGVSMLDASEKYQLYQNGIMLNDEITSGVVVVEVSKATPADIAGIKKGDVILELNGKKIEDIANFKTQLYKCNIGDTITLRVYRDNKIKDIKVKLDVVLENSN